MYIPPQGAGGGPEGSSLRLVAPGLFGRYLCAILYPAQGLRQLPQQLPPHSVHPGARPGANPRVPRLLKAARAEARDKDVDVSWFLFSRFCVFKDILMSLYVNIKLIFHKRYSLASTLSM